MSAEQCLSLWLRLGGGIMVLAFLAVVMPAVLASTRTNISGAPFSVQ